MKQVYLKRGKEESLLRFHPWIFSGAIHHTDEGVGDGDTVRVVNSENCFIRLLAFLDKRLGKRRLKTLLDGVGEEPEWLRGWLLLRAEAEGLPCAKEERK